MLSTDLTVGTLVEREGAFLTVEERVSGRPVLSQPGGHIDPGESPEDAAERETYEESGCVVKADSLLGVYLWIHPQTRQQFLRIVYVAELQTEDLSARLDDGVLGVHWYDEAALRQRASRLRSPVVIRAVEDYRRGQRASDELLTGLNPIERNVAAVLASASLI